MDYIPHNKVCLHTFQNIHHTIHSMDLQQIDLDHIPQEEALVVLDSHRDCMLVLLQEYLKLNKISLHTSFRNFQIYI